MRESEKIFEDTFKKELEPTLIQLGFSRYSFHRVCKSNWRNYNGMVFQEKC